MRSARRLDLLFRLATRALALSPVACSVATTLPGPTIDPATLSLDVCGGTDYEPLAGLTVSPPVDYVAIIEWQYIRDPRFAPAHRSVRVWREDGTACATSTNFAKCKARLDALSPATGWLGEQYPNPPFVQALVYTRGVPRAIEAAALLDVVCAELWAA